VAGTTSNKKPVVLDEKVCKAAIDDMLVQIHGQRQRHIRFARSGVTTSGDIDEVSCTITCVVGTRHAAIEVHSLDQKSIAAAAIRARASAELCPEDPEFVSYPGKAAWKEVAADFAEKTGLPSAQQAADALLPAVTEARSRNLNAAGFLDLTNHTYATATKAGFFGVHQATRTGFSMTARTQDGTGSGWAGREGNSLAELNVARLGLLACDKAERSRSPRALPAGVYPVLLESAATEQLLWSLVPSFDLRDAEEGNSPFSAGPGKSRLGEKLLGELTLVADPYDKRLPETPFDPEGLPRQKQVFVENGVIKSFYVSRYWAKKTNQPATALPGQMIASGPKVDRELIQGLDRGLLVTRIWYTNVVDPRTLTLTGLTRDGVFWVEGGHIVDSVNNFRFNQSLIQMFAETESYGPSDRIGHLAPSLRCSAFHMSTKSDAI
jgi:predicted Zn-dependent protease